MEKWDRHHIESEKLDRPKLTPPEIAQNFRNFLTAGVPVP